MRGSTGEKLPEWSIKLGRKMTANLLITRFSADKMVAVSLFCLNIILKIGYDHEYIKNVTFRII